VDSHIPYVGQVDVRIKEPVSLSVRIPEWVQPSEASATVNGKTHPLSFDGRYADFGALRPDDVATLAFPIAERESVIHVERRRYVIVRKGDDVVDIDPPGSVCPIYRREHYRANDTRWRKAERFLADRSARL
jgi:hypothetical protein